MEICSTAPAELLYTVSFTEAALLLGIIMPWAPEHSAVRIMAPKL